MSYEYYLLVMAAIGIILRVIAAFMPSGTTSYTASGAGQKTAASRPFDRF